MKLKLLSLSLLTLVSSVALAETASVEYQVTHNARPAVLNYNGTKILNEDTLRVDIEGGHTAVLQAGSGLLIRQIQFPCVLNNSNYSPSTATLNDQIPVVYGAIEVREKDTDVVTYNTVTPVSCTYNPSDNNPVSPATHTSYFTGSSTGVYEVTYTVRSEKHPRATNPEGVYRGSVAVTLIAG